MARSEMDPDLRRRARLLPRGMPGRDPARFIRILEDLGEMRADPSYVEIVSLGAISLRVHRPASADGRPLPALLWIHGGGYVLGRASHEDGLCRILARRVGAVVAAVDYRTAPEHPWPTALHDAHDALVHLAGRSEVDPNRIAIGGASAGGGLTAALAIHARDHADVRPVFQLLVYPMLDDRTATRTGIDERDFRMWNNRSNRYGWRSYLGAEPGGPDVPPTAAPARATPEDLVGLPPAWLGVGDLDLFHDEGVEYARRLREAGVPCPVEIVPGAFHGFEVVAADAPISRRFLDSQIAALADALGTEPRPGA